MPATVTLTGTAGPGGTVSALVLAGCSIIDIDANKNIVTVVRPGFENIPPISVAAATTVTATKSGNTWTLVIS